MVKKTRTKTDGEDSGRFLAMLGKICLAVFVGVLVVAGVTVITWVKKSEDRHIVEFSEVGGFYDSDVRIKLSTTGMMIPGIMEIKYSLDGGDVSGSAGVSYNDESAIVLEAPERGYKVYTVKAGFCYVGKSCKNVRTETYVLGKSLETDVDMTIVSISSDPYNLYDYEYGIMVPGKIFDEAIAAGEEPIGNYSVRTDDWIRDAHVTIFDSDGATIMNDDIGIQMSGGTSATLDIKSFKLVGNEKHGYRGVKYDFGDGVQTYNSLKLRSGQDQAAGNIRASVASRLAKESGFDGVFDSEHVGVFLNNEYYGIMDLQQNYSDSFLAKKFGLANSNGVVKHKPSEDVVFEAAGISELFENDLNVKENRELLEQYVDMDNYLLYYALQIMWNNTDWPMNNFEMWKYLGNNPDNKYEDGRYRFLIYDLDLIYYTEGNIKFFEGALSDQFEVLMGERDMEKGSGTTFEKVVKSDYYAEKFVGIMRRLINGPFATENVLKIVNEEADKMRLQMVLHSTVYGYNDWNNAIEIMKRAVMERNEAVRKDMIKYFEVEI